MAETMCTSGQAIARAGAHANSSVIIDKTIMDAWSNDAERQIEAETGLSIVSNFENYQLSGAASAACAALWANNIIAYDTTGYLSREADTLLNVNDAVYKACIKNMDKNKTKLTSPI
ncbi:MAG: hypothetical protein ACTSQE_14690 [Candidatus Heimdallarchaeaceae archaeon]